MMTDGGMGGVDARRAEGDAGMRELEIEVEVKYEKRQVCGEW